MKERCRRLRSCYCKCETVVAFGLGLMVASFCPVQLTLFLSGLLLVSLGIAVAKHC